MDGEGHRVPAYKKHACQFEVEIHDNDDDNYCNCCKTCEHECAMDI